MGEKRAARMDDGEAGEALAPYQRSLEIKRAARWMGHMVRLHDKDGRLPEGMREAELQQAKDLLKDLKATDVAAAALVGGIDGAGAFFLWNRTRRTLHALAPLVLMRLADKIDDAGAPGSERILSEVAKGLGLLVPGAPMDDGDREKSITKEDIASMSDEEINRRLAEMEETE